MNDTILNRPDPAPDIQARLAVDYPDIPDAISDYEQQVANLPAEVSTKEDHDRYVDLLTKIRSKDRAVEATRVAEKDIFLKSERAVDGFFSPHRAKLGGMVTALTRKVKIYLDAKAEAERQERLKAQREEEARLADLRRQETERLLAAERARKEANKAANAIEAERLRDEANRQEAVAAQAREAASVKPADLARTRSEQGTLSTLKAEWMFTVEDWDAIDLNTLRAYIKREHIESAIKSYIRMGGRELAGVRIFEGTKAQVR